MQINDWKKYVLGLVATVSLGALGSGLWELAIKPGFAQFVRLILTVATLGSNALRDRIYLSAAQGNLASSLILSKSPIPGQIAVGFGFVLIIVCAVIYDKLDISDRKRVRKSMVVAFCAINAILLMETLRTFSDLEANDLYTYFHQSLTICRPYMSDHQEQLFESRFASLRTRAEYVEITDGLKQVASANHLRLPDFTPW